MDSAEFLEQVAAGNTAAVRAAFRIDPSLADANTESGATALQWAVYNRQGDLADALITDGFPVDFASACTTGRLTEIPEATDVNALSPDGFTPLALAVAFGHNDAAKLLMDRGANPNARSTALGGVAPIHAAIFGQNRTGMKLLLQAGADVNAPQQGGFTALHGAAQNGDLETVNLLLDHGAKSDALTDEGKSALDFAEAPEVRERLSGLIKRPGT